MSLKLRTEDVSRREIDGETVILDLRTSTYLSVNRVGTTLLELLAEGRSTDELTDALVAEFDIARSTAESDVGAFLDDLLNRGLLDGAR